MVAIRSSVILIRAIGVREAPTHRTAVTNRTISDSERRISTIRGWDLQSSRLQSRRASARADREHLFRLRFRKPGRLPTSSFGRATQIEHRSNDCPPAITLPSPSTRRESASPTLRACLRSKAAGFILPPATSAGADGGSGIGRMRSGLAGDVRQMRSGGQCVIIALKMAAGGAVPTADTLMPCRIRRQRSPVLDVNLGNWSPGRM